MPVLVSLAPSNTAMHLTRHRMILAAKGTLLLRLFAGR
jgi:hypothetical protein